MKVLFQNLKKQDIVALLCTAVLVVVQVWLELKMPDYTQKLTSAVSTGSISMSDVMKNGGMMLLCALGSMAAAIAGGFFASQLAANMARTLRSKLFNKISSFSSAEINHFTTPSLITRTTNDVVQVQNLLAMGLQMLLKAPITAVWALMKIQSASMEWTMATLITVGIIIVLLGSIVGLCFKKFRLIQKLTDQLNDATRENLTGVRVIRAFNAEEYQQKKFARVNDDITNNQLFTSRTTGLMMPIMTICMNGLTLAIYFIGAILINQAAMADKATIFGNMTAFTQYALQVVMSFMMVVAMFIILPRTMVSVKRIEEVLNTKPSITYPTQSVKTTGKGVLKFNHVSFSYSDDGKPVLSDISFTAESGETVAIIGATGSGKSTLVNLIPRFYDVTSGSITLDGVDLREFPEKDLEARVSIAPQKAILFAGDIASNVTYGADHESKDDDPRLKEALDIAQAEFVADLPEGIHAPVAQGGTNFSGGQKQRLSIARAVYPEAEVVIFDDTFSALDYKTDMLVRKGLREKLSTTTVILVAQRIGTIKNADKILVLDKGRIVGCGKHKELLETCSVYHEIALSQLSKEGL